MVSLNDVTTEEKMALSHAIHAMIMTCRYYPGLPAYIDAVIAAGWRPAVKDEGCPCPFDCGGCHDGDGVCDRGNPELWDEQDD